MRLLVHIIIHKSDICTISHWLGLVNKTMVWAVSCYVFFWVTTVYPKKYAHGFCFAVLCCGYTLTDFPISIRLTSLALWQSNDCPSASKATLMNMDKYFMWIHYEWLHNHNKAKHNKTVCIFLGIYCTFLIHIHVLIHVCPWSNISVRISDDKVGKAVRVLFSIRSTYYILTVITLWPTNL